MLRWIRTREPPGGRAKDMEISPKNHFLEKCRKATLGNWNGTLSEGRGMAWEWLRSEAQVASEPTLQLQAQILLELGARASFLENKILIMETKMENLQFLTWAFIYP
jgi:hypothetical protein